MVLELRHSDYFLFRRILEHNIGAAPRTIFSQTQSTLPQPESVGSEGNTVTKNTDATGEAVLYNYDLTDVPPPTYRVNIAIAEFGVHFVTDDDSPATFLDCSGFDFIIRFEMSFLFFLTLFR